MDEARRGSTRSCRVQEIASKLSCGPARALRVLRYTLRRSRPAKGYSRATQCYTHTKKQPTRAHASITLTIYTHTRRRTRGRGASPRRRSALQSDRRNKPARETPRCAGVRLRCPSAAALHEGGAAPLLQCNIACLQTQTRTRWQDDDDDDDDVYLALTLVRAKADVDTEIETWLCTYVSARVNSFGFADVIDWTLCGCAGRD